MNDLKVKIGITGGIGSGKSFLSAALRRRGIPVFDSDDEARKLMLSDEGIINSLKTLFGENVYIDGKLNKPLLVSYIFGSQKNASKVNSIVHPCVRRAFLSWADECFSSGYNIVGIESAILFEAGLNDIVDKVVMVHAPLETRISRVMNRDKTSREKVLDRIKSQMDDSKKMAISDYIIENDGIGSVDEQIDNLISGLMAIKDI